MDKTVWKLKNGIVFRGDVAGGVALPVPNADKSMIRHILYLEGYGRTTPYLSATESKDIAEFFASGQVYSGKPVNWGAHNVTHWSRKTLKQLLKGNGKGNAQWSSAFEVLQASKYVEEHQEHLADFSNVNAPTSAQLIAIVQNIFS